MDPNALQSAMVALCFWLSVGVAIVAAGGSLTLLRAWRQCPEGDRWFVGGLLWASACVLGNAVLWVYLLSPYARGDVPGSPAWVVAAAVFLASQSGLMLSGLYIYVRLRSGGPGEGA